MAHGTGGTAAAGRRTSLLTGLAIAAALGGVPAAASAAGQAITISAQKGTTVVTGAGALKGGFTTITMAAAPGHTVQNLVLIRLQPGVSVADLLRATRHSADVPEDLITLPTSSSPPPGGSFTTTVRLAPGRYVAAQVPDGPGFGPYAEFTVAPGAVGSAPAATARLSLIDYGIRGPASIPGRGTLLIRNIGKNFHFLFGVRLPAGVDPAGVIASIRAGTLQGPPPGEPVGLIGLVSPGTSNYVKTNLKPGTYVIACFFADRHSGGLDHSHFGMVRRIEVT